MSSDSLSEVYESGQTRLSNVDNLRERSLAGVITVLILVGMVLMGSPAGAVSTTLSGPTDDVDLNDNDDVTLTYEIEIEDGERINIDGYEFELIDDEGDSTTIEADGATMPLVSIGEDNSDAIDIDITEVVTSSDFSGVQSQFGYGYLSGYDNAAGYDAFAGYGYGYGYGYSASSDNTASISITIPGDAFDTGDYTATAEVVTDGSGSTSFGDNSASFTVVDSTPSPSPTTGGGGGGASPAADDDTDDEDDVDVTDDEERDVPTVADVRDELDQTEPSTQSTTPIVDNAPENPGVTVNPEETESVSEITFSSDDASGNVDITEWQDPPESVSESVSGAATDDVEEDANTEASASVPTVADIDPDSDEVRGDSSTVQMTVEADRLDDSEDATIVHERDDSWETLETTVVETEDGEVTLEAETESFSLFAVAEVQTEEAEEDEPVDDVEDADDGLGTTGLIGLVVALALIVAAAVAYRQLNAGDNNGL